MSKLTGENLEFFVTHYEKFQSAYRTQIYFCFDSKQDGKSAFVMLKRVYSAECNYSQPGIDYRDFYLGFTSPQTRDHVLADIEQAVSSYQAAHGIDPVNPGSGGSGKKGLGSTSVLLIAGAAVAVVLALVFTRKKKK